MKRRSTGSAPFIPLPSPSEVCSPSCPATFALVLNNVLYIPFPLFRRTNKQHLGRQWRGGEYGSVVGGHCGTRGITGRARSHHSPVHSLLICKIDVVRIRPGVTHRTARAKQRCSGNQESRRTAHIPSSYGFVLPGNGEQRQLRRGARRRGRGFHPGKDRQRGSGRRGLRILLAGRDDVVLVHRLRHHRVPANQLSVHNRLRRLDRAHDEVVDVLFPDRHFLALHVAAQRTRPVQRVVRLALEDEGDTVPGEDDGGRDDEVVQKELEAGKGRELAQILVVVGVLGLHHAISLLRITPSHPHAP